MILISCIPRVVQVTNIISYWKNGFRGGRRGRGKMSPETEEIEKREVIGTSGQREVFGTSGQREVFGTSG